MVTTEQPAPKLWWRRLIMLLLLLWTVKVTWLSQLAGWSGELIGWTPESLNAPAWASVIQGGLLLIPLLLAWRLWRMARYKAISSIWLASTILTILLALTRLWPSIHPQSLLLTQITVTALFGWMLSRWLPVHLSSIENTGLQALNGHADIPQARASGSAKREWIGVPLAISAGALLVYPWVVIGSLGSMMDLLLALVLGFLIGWVANLLVNRIWLQSLREDSRGLGRDGLTGGAITGTALLILASGVSFNGVQLLLMLALSASGWILIACSDSNKPESAGSSSGPWWLVGLVCGLILAFTDSDATLLQAMDSLLSGYYGAALATVGIALLLGILALILRYRVGGWGNSSTTTLAGLALLLTGGLIYHLVGQPGFHGDSLFVVMKSQADVSAAETMTGNAPEYDARRRFVYDTLVAHASESQLGLRADLERFGIAYTPYYLVNAVDVEGGLLVRLWLSTRSDIDRILASPDMRPLAQAQIPASGTASPPSSLSTGQSTGQSTEPTWNITNIGADRAWAEFGTTGAGIIIGQSDSGAEFEHPEVADSYRGTDDDGTQHDYNWFDPWGETAAPSDVSGHGTHTLGSILGNSVGVAPDAEWIGCANLYRNLGNPAFYLDCMQFMLAPFPVGGNPLADGDPTLSAHVLNNSWGCPQEYEGCDPESLRPAVAALRAAGIFVVASAGNSGPECSTITDSIAIYDEAFSVGAVNAQNDLALFSSVGPVVADGSGRIKPDILAPGVDVLSAYPNGTYEEASGTSMAGPHVAGVVALIWSANPALIGDIDRTEQILIASARPFTGTLDLMIPEEMEELMADEDVPNFFDAFFPSELPEGACIGQTDLSSIPNNVAGFGIVDAYAAVEMAVAER